MQNYTLTLSANKRPEVLERLLRVIRHRGFEVVTLNVENRDNLVQFHTMLQSTRDISLLVHQLVKLPDVISVEAR